MWCASECVGAFLLGLSVRGCLVHVLKTSFYLIIKFYAKKKKKKVKKLCKDYSRYSLVVVCPDCFPSLEAEVLFFPASCCCSSEVLQYFHCPYRPGLSWNQSILSSVPALSSLPVSNVDHVARGIAVFLLKQKLSSMKASMFEPGHAGNCSQQGVTFF